jgi:cytoskeletal protein CcmA (bactofilin family)
MDGKIKGNIQMSGKAHFMAIALVSGNVKAQIISVEEGAKIQARSLSSRIPGVKTEMFSRKFRFSSD